LSLKVDDETNSRLNQFHGNNNIFCETILRCNYLSIQHQFYFVTEYHLDVYALYMAQVMNIL